MPLLYSNGGSWIGRMKITKKSIYTNRTNTMEIDITDELYERYRAGENIDEHLTFDEREFMSSGATPEEMDDVEDDDGGFEAKDHEPYGWEW